MSDDRPDDEKIEKDDLEGGLFEAFKGEPGESILGAISRIHGGGESVLLRETQEDDTAPILFQGGDDAIKDDSRYQILGEIARGGIGIVYRARDKDLNRDVALKVLRPDFKDREDVIERFVEEAQVGGQLQHPGIVPVYALGMQDDGRPSFAMKLIKGRTLAELLETNPRGIDLLSVFEQVALTIAYAHSRNVIHRDLKPANVMVGAFGEVQVVDWGFGKVIGRATKQATRRPEHTIVATLRSGSIGSQSIDGSVMGTPAYMPPEQALGHIDELDERADVFALGAILCEILTGKAPYTGKIQDQIIAASQCRTDDALARLEDCDAADPLKDLTRACLENLTEDRPRNARVVADRIAAHFATNEQRAREAELEAVESETQAAQLQKKKSRTIALGAVAAVVIFVLGGGALWFRAEKASREANAAPQIAEALREAATFEGEKEYAPAVAAAQRAVDVARAQGVDDTEANGVLAKLETDKQVHDEAERVRLEDEAFLDEMRGVFEKRRESLAAAEDTTTDDADGATAGRSSRLSSRGTMMAMDAAFERLLTNRFGSVEASVDTLKASPHVEEYAWLLAYWAALRKQFKVTLEGKDWESLVGLARTLDPAREDVWDAFVSNDPGDVLAVAEAHGDALPVALAAHLGFRLIELDRPVQAIRHLQRWHRRRPDSHRLNKYLVFAASRVDARDLEMRHATALVALRPDLGESWIALGNVLSGRRPHQAVRAYERVRALLPDDPSPVRGLAVLAARTGDLAKALELCREAVALDPNDPASYRLLGSFLRSVDESDEGLAMYRKAVEIRPKNGLGRVALARVLAQEFEEDEALAEVEKGLELDPESLLVRQRAAEVYRALGEHEAALEVAREGVRIHPELAGAHTLLGAVHAWKGDEESARAALLEAYRLDPKHEVALGNLAKYCLVVGDLDAALDYANQLVDAVPWSVSSYVVLARVLNARGDADGELAALERGLALDPDNVATLEQLSEYLSGSGRAGEALRFADRAVALKPNRPNSHVVRARALAALGRAEDALEAAEMGLSLGPTEGWLLQTYSIIIIALQHLDRPEEALDYARESVALNQNNPTSHENLGAVLMSTGDLDGAVQAIRTSIELTPTASAWALLADVLMRKTEFDQARDAIREAVELAPRSANLRSRLGQILRHRREFDEAEKELRHALELDPTHLHATMQLGYLLANTGREAESFAQFERAVEEHPDSAYAHAILADQRQARGDLDGAIESIESAIALNPDHIWVHSVHANLLTRIGDMPGAEDAFRRAFELDLDHPATLRSYSRLRMRREDLDGALELARRAFELDPAGFESMQQLGDVLRNRGDSEEAERIFLKAVADFPKHVDPRMGLALTYLGSAEYEKMAHAAEGILALEAHPLRQALAHTLLFMAYRAEDRTRATGHLEKAKEIAGDDPHFNYYRVQLGQAFSSAGEHEAAEAVLRQALEIEPDSWPALLALGRTVFVRSGYDREQEREAIRIFRRVLELNPRSVVARALQAFSLERINPDAAIIACREILERDPQNWLALSILGRCLFQIGEFAEAAEVLDHAVDVQPDDAPIRLSLGQALLRTQGWQDDGRAAEQLQRALELGPHIPMAHQYLAFTLSSRGDFAGAERAAREGLRLLRDAQEKTKEAMKDDYEETQRAFDESQVESYERQIKHFQTRALVAPRYDAFVSGAERPEDVETALAIAYLARRREDYATSLRFYELAMELDPEFTEPKDWGDTYNAACEAALAGEEFHPKALRWLRADLQRAAESLADENDRSARFRLGMHRFDPDFESVRDVEDLPSEWKAFWADHGALRERATKRAMKDVEEFWREIEEGETNEEEASK